MTTTAPSSEARAPAPRRRSRKRVVYIVAAIVCVVAIGALVVGGLRNNIVYFRTVSEAVTAREKGSDLGRFRIAGEYVPGTFRDDGKTIRFDVTDGAAVATIVHRGDEPTLFRSGVDKGEEVPVVCEGRWGADGMFESDRLMVKHGNEYKPPGVDQSKVKDPNAT